MAGRHPGPFGDRLANSWRENLLNCAMAGAKRLMPR